MEGFINALVAEMPNWMLWLLGLPGGGQPSFSFDAGGDVRITPEGVLLPGQTEHPQTGEPVTPDLNQWGGRYGLSPFMAGEKGPEMVFPRSGGFVASNHLLRNLANTMMNPLSTGGYNRYNNNYAPNFYTTPTPEVLQANRDMYSEWVISGMASR